MSRHRRTLGFLPWVVLAAAVFHVVGLIGMIADPDRALRGLMENGPALRVARYALPLGDLGLAVLFGVSAYRALRIRAGVKGKLRAILLGLVGVVHFPLVATTWSLFLAAMLQVGTRRLASFFSPTDVVYLLDAGQAAVLETMAKAALVTAVPFVPLVLSHWFVLPEKPRARFFVVFDAVVAFAFVYAIAKLPIAPLDEHPATKLTASLRHLLTALFAIRLFVRVLPFGFDAFERITVHTLVAARHLRSRRSSFLSAISFLSILAVMASTCLLSSVLSVMGGFRADLERKILGNSAHVVVDRSSGNFEGWEATRTRIASTPGVQAISPYVQAQVMISSASNFQGALMRGIDPAAAAQVNALGRNLSSDRRRARGSLALLEDPRRIDTLSLRERCTGGNRDLVISPEEEGERKPPLPSDEEEPRAGILIGSELAKSLRLCVGDDIQVISPLGRLGPAGPIPEEREFRVAGIFYSGMYEYDMKQVYVLLPVAHAFLRTGGALSGFDIRGPGLESAGPLANRIRASLGRSDLRVQDWKQRNQSLFGALAVEKLVIFITLGITVLIAGFCVFATLTLMVQEKRQDVGILKAMGAPDASIVSVFLAEGLLIGVIGALSGLGVGWLAAFAAEHFGIALNPEIFYIDRLPVRVDALELVVVGTSAALVCVLSTIGPALYASRLRPIDAIRED